MELFALAGGLAPLKRTRPLHAPVASASVITKPLPRHRPPSRDSGGPAPAPPRKCAAACAPACSVLRFTCKLKAAVLAALCSSPVNRARLSVNVSAMRKSILSIAGLVTACCPDLMKDYSKSSVAIKLSTSAANLPSCSISRPINISRARRRGPWPVRTQRDSRQRPVP